MVAEVDVQGMHLQNWLCRGFEARVSQIILNVILHLSIITYHSPFKGTETQVACIWISFFKNEPWIYCALFPVQKWCFLKKCIHITTCTPPQVILKYTLKITLYWSSLTLYVFPFKSIVLGELASKCIIYLFLKDDWDIYVHILLFVSLKENYSINASSSLIVPLSTFKSSELVIMQFSTF